MAVTRSKQQFTNLLVACQNRIAGCIYAMLHNLDDTEEVFQQVCLTMWEKFDTFEPGTDFSKWGCGVARLKVMSFLQKRRTGRIAFTDEFVDELAVWEGGRKQEEEDRLVDALRGCMEHLSDRDRRLLELRYSDKSTKVVDIAQQLGRPPQGISNSLGRIRAWLLECVRRTFAVEGC